MQQSICDAMMDEMGKGLARLERLISDFVEIMQQSICDAMMDEMGKDCVDLID
jgi:hypothetical protein